MRRRGLAASAAVGCGSGFGASVIRSSMCDGLAGGGRERKGEDGAHEPGQRRTDDQGGQDDCRMEVELD